MMSFITTPLNEETIKTLKSGDRVLITGVIYTARDAAHKRLVEAIEKGKKLPFDMKDQIIYYMGPAPAKPGHVIGSAGPTEGQHSGSSGVTDIRRLSASLQDDRASRT